MRRTIKRISAVCVLFAALAVGSCATQLEVDQLRSELDSVRAEAQAAKAAAAAANARAEASAKAAADVSRKAERMYDKSLRK